MRDYAKVSPLFWTGNTGRAIRKMGPTVQLAALYLITGPGSNMLGVFHCPVVTLAHAIGSPFEGALEGLRSLSEGGFCTYDEDSEWVWVHEMAAYQIGNELKQSDNQVKHIQKEWLALPAMPMLAGFYERYAKAYHLPERGDLDKPLGSPFEGVSSKPLRSQEQEQEQEQEIKEGCLTTPVNGKSVDACPHSEIVSLYHEILPMLPFVKVLGEPRRKHLRTRWRESEERQSLDWWRGYFSTVAESDFLTGKVTPDKNGHSWLPNFDWLINPSNMTKVIEGNYSKQKSGTSEKWWD